MEALFILLKDETKDNFMVSYIIDLETIKSHLDGCIKFNNMYNLGIKNIEDMTSHEVALEIANLGYSSIHVCGDTTLIYLPAILSDNQYKWFIDNKKLLSKSSLNVISIQIDNTIKDLSDNKKKKYSCKFSDLKRELKIKKLLKEKLELEAKKTIKKMG